MSAISSKAHFDVTPFARASSSVLLPCTGLTHISNNVALNHEALLECASQLADSKFTGLTTAEQSHQPLNQVLVALNTINGSGTQTIRSLEIQHESF